MGNFSAGPSGGKKSRRAKGNGLAAGTISLARQTKHVRMSSSTCRVCSSTEVKRRFSLLLKTHCRPYSKAKIVPPTPVQNASHSCSDTQHGSTQIEATPSSKHGKRAEDEGEGHTAHAAQQ